MFRENGFRLIRDPAGLSGFWPRLVLLVGICLVFSLGGIGSAGAEEGGGGPVYLRLKPISFSVIGDSNKIDREVSIVLNLELEDGKTEQMMDVFKRKLLDAFLLSLSEAYDAAPGNGTPISTVDLKERLLKAAVNVTGPGYVHSVLIIAISERKH